MENMYIMKIDECPIAISDSIEKLMNTVQQEVIDFLKVKDINCLTFGVGGIIYKPWSHKAECVCAYKGDVCKVLITRIKTL